MILLLDAHAVVWWFANDATLAADARSAIADPANDVLVSSATVWEIEIKRALGRIESPDDLLERIDRAAFSAVPITTTDAVRAARLAPFHRDPFDRMLVAQAIARGAVIVSRDRAFDAYDAPVLRA